VSYNVLQCYVRLAFDTRLLKWLASSSFNYGKALGSFQEDSSHRLWKWLASSSPRLWNCLCNSVLRFVQLCLTAYGNGWQAVLPAYETAYATLSYSLCNCVLRLMEMVSKQFCHLWKRF